MTRPPFWIGSGVVFALACIAVMLLSEQLGLSQTQVFLLDIVLAVFVGVSAFIAIMLKHSHKVRQIDAEIYENRAYPMDQFSSARKQSGMYLLAANEDRYSSV